MIPETRLAVLLNQVKDSWISECLYHNTKAEPSLFYDHQCGKQNFPLQNVLEISDHTDEIWFLRYSHDGSKLATASKDGTVAIYETESYKLSQKLTEHESGVCSIAWSPDDQKIITCTNAQDNSARVWDVKVSYE